MAGGKKHGKRPRKTSDPQHKSPTQSQILKKFKNQDLAEGSDCDSEYLDAEGQDLNEIENESIVSDINMAVSGLNEEALTQSLIRAFENQEVVSRLVNALRSEIQESFKLELQGLKSEIMEKDQKIKSLEDKVEGLEMYGRRNGIRIYGIPETDSENTDDIVMGIVEEIEADIERSALGRSHRVGRKSADKPRAIIAKFVGHNDKVKFLRNKKKLMETRKDEPNPVFVNEDLTSKRAGWARRTRTWKKAGKVTDCWTRDGVLFVKHNVDKEQKITKVNTDSEFVELAESLGIDLTVELTVPKSAYSVSTDEDD